MTKCTAAASLVIRLYSEALQHIADRDDYLICFSVLGEARIDADYAVRAGLIDAGNYLSVSSRGKRRLHLVAVMIRLVHADYRLDTSEFAEQPFGLSLLEAELLRVAQILKLASAAFFIERTFLFFRHVFFFPFGYTIFIIFIYLPCRAFFSAFSLSFFATSLVFIELRNTTKRSNRNSVTKFVSIQMTSTR